MSDGTAAVLVGPAKKQIGATTLHLAGETRVPSYTDVGSDIVGREYLGAWYKYWRTIDSAIAKVVGSGDSTMEATSVPFARYTPAKLLPRFGYVRGFQTTFVNEGHSGKTTAELLSTYLQPMLTAHAATPPLLLILSWGRNDPSAGITPAQTMANIATAIAMIRAVWGVNTTSILVVQPNTASEPNYGRDETWSEAMGPLFRQGARDLGYCFLDFYKMFREARYNLTTLWLTNDKLHANEDLYSLEYGAVADLIFPQWLADLRSGPFEVSYISGNPAGISLASNWPLSVYVRGQLVSLKGPMPMFNAAPIAAGTSFFTMPTMGRSSTGCHFMGRKVINGSLPAIRSNVYDVLFYMDNAGLVKNVDPINEASTNGFIIFDGASWVRNIYVGAEPTFASYQL
jgi:lysophospholipase L1-like esterase